MFLKPDVNLEKFFSQVRNCSDDVIFQSTEGDILNLKSGLCLFVFTTAYSSHSDIALSGDIICKNPDDERLLSAFLE